VVVDYIGSDAGDPDIFGCTPGVVKTVFNIDLVQIRTQIMPLQIKWTLKK